MKHFISAEQLTHPQVEDFFLAADYMRAMDQGSNVDRRELAQRHIGRQVISLFYEPSTRTRISFASAAKKLGIGDPSTENAREFSSAAKGETVEDTIKNIFEYNVDALVIRHHETGAAARAVAAEEEAEELAQAAGRFYRPLSIINAGDGKGEHPTQALLDAYTIYRHMREQKSTSGLNGIDVVLGGDLRQGRTVRSLAKLLGTYTANRLTFVSIPGFEIGDDIKQYLDEHDTEWSETSDIHQAVSEADVVYWTRLQKERIDNGVEPAQVQELIIEDSVMESMRPDAILMHPLPRVDEIAKSVDRDPRAAYFRQAGNGMYVRMALLDYFLGQNS